MELREIQLAKGRERSIERKHPWIFSGGVTKVDPEIKAGDIVQLIDFKGKWLANAFYEGGSIAAKIISFENTIIDEAFWNQKIEQAFAFRKQLGLPSKTQTNVFRLFHGEGDFLPGLVVDIYDSVAVIQPHSNGIKAIEPLLAKIISKELPFIKSVVSKSTSSGNTEKNEVRWILGEPKPMVRVIENGILFDVDVEKGQKTGFFIDQRVNRQKLALQSTNKCVLNTFSYTGGFSCYALTAGAQSVLSIDLGNNAMSLLDQNVALTGCTSKHTSLQADVFDYFSSENEMFDVIVLDPPAFAKHNSAKHNALQAYKRLNTLALKKLNPGGFLHTFSCSQVVTPDLFEGAVTAAAIDTGYNLRMVERLFQSPDHPWNIYHPESLYLKGLILYKE